MYSSSDLFKYSFEIHDEIYQNEIFIAHTKFSLPIHCCPFDLTIRKKYIVINYSVHVLCFSEDAAPCPFFKIQKSALPFFKKSNVSCHFFEVKNAHCSFLEAKSKPCLFFHHQLGEKARFLPKITKWYLKKMRSENSCTQKQ